MVFTPRLLMVQYRLWRPTAGSADVAPAEHRVFQKSPCRSGDGYMRAQEIYGRYRVLIAAIAAQAEWTADWIGDLRHTVRLFESEMGTWNRVTPHNCGTSFVSSLNRKHSFRATADAGKPFWQPRNSSRSMRDGSQGSNNVPARFAAQTPRPERLLRAPG